jgi:hypothetical protein
MDAQQEIVGALVPGDIVRLEHDHEVGARCLADRGAEGLILKIPPAGMYHKAVHWVQVDKPEVSGVCILPSEAHVLRTGHMAVAA